jgi:hypothetical protein
MPKKKLELKTFMDLTQENQQKVGLYLFGALILLMIGISGVSSGAAGLILAAVGIPIGSWLGYTGYKILIDSKNEKKCNAKFWTVTENVGFDTDDYDSDMGTTLCEAQLKAEYNGDYTGFFCTSNAETEDTIDAYYFTTKKLTIKNSGTSNVFTAKSTVKVTDPPGSFKIEFVGSPSSATVTIRGSSFIRIDETKNVSVTVTTTDTSSPPSSPVTTTSSYTIQQLKDGIVLQRGNVFSITAYSTTQDGVAVTKSLTIR